MILDQYGRPLPELLPNRPQPDPDAGCWMIRTIGIIPTFRGISHLNASIRS